MTRYIIRRLLWVVVVLVVITLITFLIFFIMPPTDPARAFAGKSPTPAVLNALRKQFGLDQPWYVQYGRFVKGIFLGDEYGWPGFGFSFITRSAVREEIFDRIAVTVQLAAGAAVVWMLLGLPIGIVSALKRRSWADRLGMGFALFGVSAPVFWLGLMFLFIFWETLGVASGTGYVPFGENPLSWANHLIMPWVVLALLFAAFYARMVRGNMLEVLSEDYIRTARAKGLRERDVVLRHGVRSSLTPIVTMLGLDLGTLLGGAIITETVFNLPGLGDYTVKSVAQGDLPVVMAVTVFAAFSIAIISLVVDVVYAFLDPRVRYA